MKLYAIADLHLSFARPKPMDIFGEHWRDHHVRIATSWKSTVTDEDIVLVAGDISWAMKPAQAEADLAWLRELPGTKILVKGNHDYWLPKSHQKRNKVLGQGVIGLYKTAAVVDGVGFVGGKGCPFDPFDEPDEDRRKKLLKKQAAALRASIAALERDERSHRATVALLHYPPAAPGETTSPLTDILEEAGVNLCVYGHLHQPDDFASAIQGSYRGVTYCLTSADFLNFELLDVTHHLPRLVKVTGDVIG